MFNVCLGLVKFAEELGLTLLVPRRKITVLLIGNHSAGKSSFINWYVCMSNCAQTHNTLHMHTYTLRTHVYTHTQHTYTSTHTHEYTHSHTHICTHTQYTHMYICTCNTHTHIHTCFIYASTKDI